MHQHPVVVSILLSFWLVISLLINCSVLANAESVTCSGIVPIRYRSDVISIEDFGGVGDEVTLNTKAFQEAIYRIQHLRRPGGSLLYVPAGEFFTGTFNLTSHMTLFLARNAVIKATTVYKCSLSSSHWNISRLYLALIVKIWWWGYFV